MIDNLTGLCIGGPDDGKRRSNPSPYYRVFEAPPFDPACFEQTDLMAVEMNLGVVEYRYERMRGEHQEFGVWVPRGMSMDEALRRLFNNYTPADC